MKKTKALSILEEEVKAIISLYKSGKLITDKEIKEAAQLLLNCITWSIGMRPPTTDKPVIIGTDGFTQKAAAYDISNSFKNSWDMEDDEYQEFLEFMKNGNK